MSVFSGAKAAGAETSRFAGEDGPRQHGRVPRPRYGGENDVVHPHQDRADDKKNPDELVSDRPG